MYTKRNRWALMAFKLRLYRRKSPLGYCSDQIVMTNFNSLLIVMQRKHKLIIIRIDKSDLN